MMKIPVNQHFQAGASGTFEDSDGPVVLDWQRDVFIGTDGNYVRETGFAPEALKAGPTILLDKSAHHYDLLALKIASAELAFLGANKLMYVGNFVALTAIAAGITIGTKGVGAPVSKGLLVKAGLIGTGCGAGVVGLEMFKHTRPYREAEDFAVKLHGLREALDGRDIPQLRCERLVAQKMAIRGEGPIYKLAFEELARAGIEVAFPTDDAARS